MSDKKVLVDFNNAPYNPRAITEDALEGLEKSIRIFGDLSGLVINDKTGNMICGHQRRKILIGQDLSDITWGKTHKAELGHESARFTSHEQEGSLVTKDGARFHVRKVSWELAFEQAANIAANDERLQGVWDTGMLTDVVATLELTAPELVDTFDLSSLKVELDEEAEPDEAPVMVERNVRALPKTAWILIGVPIGEFAKVSDFVEKCSADESILCEVTYNDDDGKA